MSDTGGITHRTWLLEVFVRRSPKSRIVAAVLLAAFLPSLATLAAHVVFGDTPYVQEPLHEGFELAGSCIALGVAMLLLLRLRNEQTSPHLLWVVAALAVMGLADMTHGIAHFGVEWSWLRHGGTLAGGMLFALVWLPVPTFLARRQQSLILLVVGLALAGSITIWMRAQGLPAPWGSQGYTLAPKLVNALGGVGFLAAAVFFSRRRLRQRRAEDLVFASQTALFATASLLFTFSEVWTAGWWVWHGARLMAYVIALVAVYEMVASLHQQIARHAHELEDRVRVRTAELHDSEEKLRSAFVNAAIGFAMTTPDGRFVDANPAYCRLTGYSIEELLALEFSQMIHPDDHAANMALIGRMLAGQIANFTIVNRYVRKGGQPVWVRKSVSVVRAAQGAPKWIIALIEDITEAKQAEELGRQRLMEIEDLYRNAPVGLCVLDRDLRWIRINERLAEINGFPAAAHIGKRVGDLMPKLAGAVEPEMRRVLETGQPRLNIEIAGETPAQPGVRRTWLEQWLPLTDAQGRVTGISIVVEETTDRKRADEELRQSRQDLDRAQEVGQIGWWRLDVRRNVLTWSDENHRIFGVPKGTPLTYEAFLGTVHPDDRQYVDTKWNAGLRGEPYDIEHRIVADGKVKWVREKAYLEFDSAGGLMGGFGITQDITARKTAEEEARRTEEERKVAEAVRAERQRLFAVLETLPAMICLLTPDHHVAFANRSFRDRFGQEQGRPCYEWCFGRTAPCEFCQTYEVLATGRPHHWEITAQDGTVIDAYALPFTDADGSPMILEMELDITERRRAERELQNAHKNLAERATQLRALASELTLSEQRERRRLARVLHDNLQQLLIAAKYRSAIVRRQGDDSTRQAAAEIEGLLDESISAARSLTAELSPPVLHEAGLPAGLRWLVRWMADRHGLTVDLTVDDGLPPLAEDLRVLLFESVRELLFNAVKHARVASASVDVRLTAGTSVGITVSDSGTGFDPGTLTWPFEGGHGFGLFGIRERLGLLGGRMDIDSTPGSGSRFTLTLPLGPPARTAPPAVSVAPPGPREAQAVTAPSPDAGASVRVLIADDHAVVRQGLSRLLGQEPDMQIAGEAADGQEAVRMARTLRPDVILMDMDMPKLDGVEATRAIHHEYPDIRIIGLSVFDDANHAEAMRHAGATDYLTKGVPPHDLLSAIRRVCQPPATKSPRPGPVRAARTDDRRSTRRRPRRP